MSPPPLPSKPSLWRRVFRFVGLVLLGHLVGVLFANLVSIAEFELAGVFLLPWYLLAAPVGVIFLTIIFFQDPEIALDLWVVWPVFFAPFLIETVLVLAKRHRFRVWRGFWIGFPIGFLGTVGIYFAAAQTI